MILDIKKIICAIVLLFGSIIAGMAQNAPQISVDQQVFNFGSIEEAKGLTSHVLRSPTRATSRWLFLG